jgi:hypothetical protein
MFHGDDPVYGRHGGLAMEAVLEKLLVEVLAVVAQVALIRLLAWWRDRASGAHEVLPAL